MVTPKTIKFVPLHVDDSGTNLIVLGVSVGYLRLQGDLVRKLKEEKADVNEVKKAVVVLKARKKALEDKVNIKSNTVKC